MEGFINRAAESAPDFIALIVLVLIFLRGIWMVVKMFMAHIKEQEAQLTKHFTDYTEKQEARFIDHINKKDKQFEDIAREMAAFMESSTNKMHSAIERNTAVLEHVKIVIAKKETEANG